MLTREGSAPGPAWMRRVSEGATDPATLRRWSKGLWACFAALMVFTFLLGHIVERVAAAPSKSELRIGGLPLVACGLKARGIIAIGGQATGLLALGGVAVGVIAIGGGALGWSALGGGAAGYYALGGLAVGGYAYSGNGVALGYYEASGRQKEQLLG